MRATASCSRSSIGPSCCATTSDLFVLTRGQQVDHECYLGLLAADAAPGAISTLVTSGFAGGSSEGLVVVELPNARSLGELLDQAGATWAAAEAAAAAEEAAAAAARARGRWQEAEGPAGHRARADPRRRPRPRGQRCGAPLHGGHRHRAPGEGSQPRGHRSGSHHHRRGPGCSSRLRSGKHARSRRGQGAGHRGDADGDGPRRRDRTRRRRSGSRSSARSASPAPSASSGPGVAEVPVSALRKHKAKGLLKELRAKGAAAAAGWRSRRAIELRRISWTNLILVIGTLIGGWALIGVFLNVADSFSTIENASWAWVAAHRRAGALRLPRLGDLLDGLDHGPAAAAAPRASSSSRTPSPAWPSGTPAVMAARIRFFQKQGVDTTIAVSSGVLGLDGLLDRQGRALPAQHPLRARRLFTSRV